MNLSDQIEALRRQMVAEHDRLKLQAAELSHLMFDRDAEMMRALSGIIEGQERRAVDIHRALRTIQARIGHVPSDEHAAMYGTGGPRAGIASARADEAGGQVGVTRHIPPMRAESTSGDDLGIYEPASSSRDQTVQSYGLN
jgi:hypothetical protein